VVPIGFGGCMYILLHCIHTDILRLPEHAIAARRLIYILRCRDIPTALYVSRRMNPPTRLSSQPLRPREKALRSC
jgi:hypothetical protein